MKELTEKEMNIISLVYIRKDMEGYFKKAMIVNMKYTSKRGDFNLWWFDHLHNVERKASFGFAYLSHIMPYFGKPLTEEAKKHILQERERKLHSNPKVKDGKYAGWPLCEYPMTTDQCFKSGKSDSIEQPDKKAESFIEKSDKIFIKDFNELCAKIGLDNTNVDKSDLLEQLGEDLRSDHLRGIDQKHIYSLNDWAKYLSLLLGVALANETNIEVTKESLERVRKATIRDITEMDSMKKALDTYNKLTK